MTTTHRFFSSVRLGHMGMVALLGLGALGMVFSVQAAGGECQGGSWSQETNPYESLVNTTYPGDANYAGVQGLYNAWNASHNFGWSYMDAGANACDSGGVLDIEVPSGVMSASPMTITSGGSSLLSWTTQNVRSCFINQGIGSITPNAAGSLIVSPATTTTYSMLCSINRPDGEEDKTGANLTRSVTVTVTPPATPAPTATLTANPTSITSGNSSTLTWSSTDATSCTGTNFSTGSATAGTASVSPTATTTYSVACSGLGGSGTSYATVGVTAAAAPATGIDLSAGSVSPTSATVSSATTLSAPITNTGDTSTVTGFTNLFQIDNNSDHTSITTTRTYLSGALAASSAASATASYTFTTLGTWYVRACADSNAALAGTITESNELNNCGAWTQVSVTTGSPGSSVSCNVSATSVGIGGSVTYTATPSGGASAPYSWDGADGAGYGSASTVTRTLSTGGTYSMSVSASGTATAQCPLVTAATNWCTATTPDLVITASPNRVRTGQTSTITWAATGVTGQNATCTVSGPGVSWSSPVSAAPVCSAGSSAAATISTQSTYTLTCGSSVKTVTVNVIPNFTEF